MDAGRESNRLQMFHSVAVSVASKLGQGTGEFPLVFRQVFGKDQSLHSFE